MIAWYSAGSGVSHLVSRDKRFVITQRTDGGYTLLDNMSGATDRVKFMCTAQALAEMRAALRPVHVSLSRAKNRPLR